MNNLPPGVTDSMIEDAIPGPEWDDLFDDLFDSGLTPAEIRARIKPIGAVLAYRLEGSCGVRGQAIGADGAGEYACIIHGDADRAHRWAQERIHTVMRSANRMTAITIVTADPGYYGPHLEIIHPEDTP